MKVDVAELESLYDDMTADERAEVDALIAQDVRDHKWRPLIDINTPDVPTPQQQAFESKADILLYGGSAGGGKSNLISGLAATHHHRSIIYRREIKQLNPLIDEIINILGNRKGYNGLEKRFNLPGGRSIRFGGMQHLGDEQAYQGDPRDFIAYDEVTQILEQQFRYLITWNRVGQGAPRNQRCRVIATSNPPTTAEGEWIIRFWAPWLDPNHPRPALPGELRWFYSDENGKDVEADGPEPVIVNGEPTIPRSRTFIPSSVDDNPFLMATGYKSNLQALPEPLRSQMLRGDFTAGGGDDAYQVLPTEWVKAAQDRWKPEPPKGKRMSALGVDPSRGGDEMVLSPRYDNWFGEQHVYDGKEVRDGMQSASLCIKHVKHGAVINIDVIGTAGPSPFDHLRQNNANVNGLVGNKACHARDKSGKFGFYNMRAYWIWSFREALDPENGVGIMLPPDTQLRADLCAARWRLTSRGIQVEGKSASMDQNAPDGWGNLKKRLGRSPNKGDSCIYAWIEDKKHGNMQSERPKMANRAYSPHRWRKRRT